MAGNALPKAATSSPAANRIVFAIERDTSCELEIQNCYDMSGMTYETQGEATSILCYNPSTGKNEVVGVIQPGGSQEVTFDLTRLLPRDDLSKLLRLAKSGCGIRMYFLRGDTCRDPFNVNDFAVIGVFSGPVTFSTYSRTEMLHKDEEDTAQVEESVSVKGFAYCEMGRQNIGIFGAMTLADIVDVVVCDNKQCGADCGDDSDGCQHVYWIQSDGTVGYTTNQFESEVQLATNTGIDTPQGICCNGRHLVVYGVDGAGEGEIAYASLSDVNDGEPVTWTVINTLTNGNTFTTGFSGCIDCGNTFNLYRADVAGVGEEPMGGLQLNPSTGTAVLIGEFPSTDVFNDAQANGDVFMIGGMGSILFVSVDGGQSFLPIDITDPATNAPLAVDISAVEPLTKTTWTIGLTDGRYLFTLDSGTTWLLGNIDGGLTGSILSIDFDPETQIGFMNTSTAWYKTYYGVCGDWVRMPENAGTLDPDYVYAKTFVCKDDPNVSMVVGDNGAGVGVIALARGNYI